MNEMDRQRRSFFKTSVGVAAIAIAPGMLLYQAAHGKSADEKSAVRWGMLIDTTQCKPDCQDCVKACNKENGLSGGIDGQARPPHPLPQAGEGENDALRPSHLSATDSQWIRKVDLKDISTGRQLSLPMMCQHCESPPCVQVCPTAASFKRKDGIVLVDKHRCIGCRYCMMACPYKARSFVHETLTDQNPDMPRGKGTVESCTLCSHRIDKGRQPACAEACQNKAILFGNLHDPNSEIAKKVQSVASMQVRADLQLNPGIRYQGL